LILFLDGDMELRPGWLDDALRVLREQPRVAVVTGQVVNLPANVSFSTRLAPAVRTRATAIEVPHGGGAALYRRQALDEVGSFNAALYSEEEPELCLRLRAAGYRILRLERPMVSHYTEPDQAISSLFSRRRRNLYLGAGQVLRLHGRSALGLVYLRERGYALPVIAGITATVFASVASLLARDARALLVWVLLALAVLAADAVRKRSVYRTVHSLLVRTLFLEGLIRGYRLGVAQCDSLPRYRVISSPQLGWSSQQREASMAKGATV
jgi:hypothetical protein